MAKHDFDGIFTGEMKEQHCKATHFLRGITGRIREEEANYADNIVLEDHDGAHRSHGQIHRLETMRDAFTDDERTQNLQKWIDAQDQKEKEERLRSLLDGVVSQILKQ